MKQKFLSALAAVTLLAIGGCATNPQTGNYVWVDNLNTAINSFNSAVVSVNAAIAADSPILAKNCNTLHDIGVWIASNVTTGGTQTDLNAINAGISSYCQTSIDDGSIGDAVDSAQKAVAAANSAYKAQTGKDWGS